MAYSILLLICFTQIFNFVFAETTKNFTCFHGWGFQDIIAIPLEKVNCKSQKCIIFYSLKMEDWATTCYEENNRMKLLKTFDTARILMNGKPKPSGKLFFCEKSECNKNPFKTIISMNDIEQDPISFDFELWPPRIENQQQEKRSLKLKNTVIIYPLLTLSSILRINGTILDDAEEVWIQFEFVDEPKRTVRTIKLTFNMLNGTIIYENGKTKDKMNWFYETPPGGNINIYFVNFTLGYRLYVNRMDQYSQIPHKNLDKFNMAGYGNLTTVRYGGKWSLTSAQRFDQYFSMNTPLNNFSICPQYEYITTPYLPCPDDVKYDPNFSYTSVAQKFENLNNSYSNFVDFNLSAPSYLRQSNYEWRENLCPGSDLVKVEIQHFELLGYGEKFYQINLWARRNGRWHTYGRIRLEIKYCKKHVLRFYSSFIIYKCDGWDKGGNLPYPNVFNMVKYFVEEIYQKPMN